MSSHRDLKNYRVVRLNATLFPVRLAEAALYRRYDLVPLLVEANTPGDIIPQVADCDALLVVSTSLPTPVIESLTHCRIISRLGTGTDKIDVATATRRGIVVSNVPWFCVQEQADHTMALILALARQLPQMQQDMNEGAWTRARANPRLQRLGGHVLGLVGFGRSAQAVAQRAKAFGMRVLAAPRRQTASAEANALGVEMVKLDQLLAESDFMSLHVPLTSETYHLIDAAALRKMKPGAYLINTARGAIVDETALVQALQEGRLGGAGLDTFSQINVHAEEEAPPHHPLMELPNVVLTPHVAAFSPEAMDELARGGVENMIAVLNGHLPHPENTVNPQVVPRVPLAVYDEGLLDRYRVSGDR